MSGDAVGWGVLIRNLYYMHCNIGIAISEGIIIVYEVKHLIITSHLEVLGLRFAGYPSHCGLYWNEISDTLPKQEAIQNMPAISSNHFLLYHVMRCIQFLNSLCIKILTKITLRY